MEGKENKNQIPESKKEEEVLSYPTETEIMADPETKVELEPEAEVKPEITKPEIESEPKPKLNITKPDSRPEEIILPKTERPQPLEMPLDEKKDLLSRAEIRTMAKDLSKLREAEAEKEKERIINLKTEQNIPKPTAESEPSPVPKIKEEKEKKEETGKLMPKPFKRPSAFQKIAIRIVAVLFLILTIAFFYWFLNVRLNQKPETTPVELEIEKVEEKIIEEPTEPVEEIVEEPTEPVEGEITEPIEIVKPEILRNIATWGFYIPKNSRLIDIDMIVIHSTYNDLDEDTYNIDKILETFKNYRVLTHYMISRDGLIYQLAPDTAVAYHSGNSQLPDGTRKNVINYYSLGIELVYSEEEMPNEIQLEKLKNLVNYLKQEYNIPTENIFGQKDLSLSGSEVPWNIEIRKPNDQEEKENYINL